MKNIIILFLLWPCILQANDCAVYGEGSTLRPMKETRVRLEKEVLQITCFQINEGFQVRVYFEFFNPDAPKTELVAFVCPENAYHSETYEEEYIFDDTTGGITNFTVKVNGVTSSWKRNFIEGLSHSSVSDFRNEYRDKDIAYYFPCTFETGINYIIHTYTFLGGIDNMGYEFFSYTLGTGNLWANGRIEDFTLMITTTYPLLGGVPSFSNINFDETNVFPKFKLLGRGAEGEGNPSFFLDSGSVAYIQQKGFHAPDHLFFTIYRGGIYRTTDDLQPCTNTNDDYIKTINNLDSLAYLRNLMYAGINYPFKSEKWRKEFSKYAWYRPEFFNPQDELALQKDETMLLIIEKEAALKNRK